MPRREPNLTQSKRLTELLARAIKITRSRSVDIAPKGEQISVAQMDKYVQDVILIQAEETALAVATFLDETIISRIETLESKIVQTFTT